jgi:ribosomal peptide maturation radical SAM protein 1
MTGAGQTNRFRATLISMPWALFNRPSLQLGALKAYVERGMEAEIATAHLSLDVAAAIGVDAYRRISLSSWAGEAVFAPLLFPGQRDKARRLFNSILGKQGSSRERPDYDTMVAEVAAACDRWLDGRDFSHTRLIGFSICFGQMLASLHLARQIRDAWPGLPVVFGGSSCCGDAGRSLLRHFPWIDYVVDGEGERPLLGLCRHLLDSREELPARVFARTGGASPSACRQIEDLDDLPLPDYRPYFLEMKKAFPEQPFIPVLPVEFSRGCWWSRCTFCNLNLQWQGFRQKTAERMTSEVDTLARQHQCLDFAFVDNALPIRPADQFFQQQRQLRQDRRFFAELRATTDCLRLEGYAKGGLSTMQVGIEALSNSLLGRMAKGVSVIDNIAIMKHSLASGIRLEGNLILEFPGSSETEVAETIANLDFVLPFTPLETAVFFLGAGSRIHRHPGDFGIVGVAPHRSNLALLPADLARGIGLQVMDFRGGRVRQREIWRPVADKVAAWHAFHRRRHPSSRPALGYRDGGEYLIIRQERVDGPPLQHRLRGISRELYLYCDRIRTREQVQQRFPKIPPSSLGRFLAELQDKRLMFLDGNRILALAVRHRS